MRVGGEEWHGGGLLLVCDGFGSCFDDFPLSVPSLVLDQHHDGVERFSCGIVVVLKNEALFYVSHSASGAVDQVRGCIVDADGWLVGDFEEGGPRGQRGGGDEFLLLCRRQLVVGPGFVVVLGLQLILF